MIHQASQGIPRRINSLCDRLLLLGFLSNRSHLTVDDVTLITIGFVAAFVSALIVVRSFLDFVSKRGFAPFAWWRIVVGLFGLAGLWIHG